MTPSQEMKYGAAWRRLALSEGHKPRLPPEVQTIAEKFEAQQIGKVTADRCYQHLLTGAILTPKDLHEMLGDVNLHTVKNSLYRMWRAGRLQRKIIDRSAMYWI